MKATSRSEAVRALRLAWPTAKIARIERAGVPGVQVRVRNGIVFQTFDLTGDVWRRVVEACLPALEAGYERP